MRSEEQGGFYLMLLSILILVATVVGLCGWAVWRAGNHKRATTLTTMSAPAEPAAAH